MVLIDAEFHADHFQNITLVDNESDLAYGAIKCGGNCDNAFFNNTIIRNNISGTLEYPNLPNIPESNITYSNIQGLPGAFTGNGNIDLEPLFCNSPVGDFGLAENSPCVGTGEDGGWEGRAWATMPLNR